MIPFGFLATTLVLAADTGTATEYELQSVLADVKIERW